MAKIRLELNRAGVRELLKSPEMEALLGERAEQIAERCGDGYAYDTYQGLSGRAVASAYTEDFHAMRDNLENNTLLKALGAGGDT